MQLRIGKVITFYSYKGGVGRSMAMANIAVVLANWGKKVLIVDWDLEAPGLEYFFFDRKKEKRELSLVRQKKGVIDILLSRAHDENFQTERINWSEYETDLSNKIQTSTGVLKLITSGQKNDEYIEKVRKFNYSEFYDTNNGGLFLEEIRTAWILDNYDYVLIDSRTGLTESGGVCTIQMPDVLLLLFTPNEQSMQGVLEVARRSSIKHENLPYERHGLMQLFIPTRFDDLDPTHKEEWLQVIDQELTPMVTWLPYSKHTGEYSFTIRQLIEQIKIPYKVKYAYGEKIAVIDEGATDPQGLGFVFETISAILVNDFALIEALQGSRDLYIKQAKGEKVLSQVELEKRIKEEQEGKTNLEKELEKQKARGKRFTTALSVIIAGVIAFFVIRGEIRKTKREDDYKEFNTLLAALSTKSGDSLNTSVCELAKYDNEYEDNRIAIAKDSLEKICNAVEVAQKTIDTNTVQVNNLLRNEPLTKMSPEAEEKGNSIDSIDHMINLTKNQIDSITDPAKKSKLRQDSIQLQIRKLSIINSDPLLKETEKFTTEIEDAVKQQTALKVNQKKPNRTVVYSNSTWFKEGYYLPFQNIKVVLRNLDARNQTITIDICSPVSPSGCKSPIVQGKTMKVNESYSFTYEGYDCILMVDKIANAGRNPFNKAVYVTFEKYTK